MVVAAHLIEKKPFLHFGVFAVFGFYIISGYLMTLILCKTYNFRLIPFATNRALRLYPTYFITAAATVAIISQLPGASDFHPAWNIAASIKDYAGNLLIFPFEFYDAKFRIVPPTWSVAVELICYFLLWALIARSKATATASLIAAAAYHAYGVLSGLGWQPRYFPFYAAALPFTLGACIFHFRNKISRLTSIRPQLKLCILISAWAANLMACGFTSISFDVFFYTNLLLLFAITAIIATTDIGKKQKIAGKFLGDMAYPIFLSHWLIGFIISALILDSQRRGYAVFALSLLPCLAFSYFAARLADRVVEPLRDTIRPRAKDAPNLPESGHRSRPSSYGTTAQL